MVVIEPTPAEEPVINHQNHHSSDNELQMSFLINKEVSEGFETASEGDHFSDRGTENGGDDEYEED